VIECQSAKAVAASSKDMPCFLRFSAAFLGSHSNFTPAVYGKAAAGEVCHPRVDPRSHVGSQQGANADEAARRLPDHLQASRTASAVTRLLAMLRPIAKAHLRERSARGRALGRQPATDALWQQPGMLARLSFTLLSRSAANVRR